MYFCYEVIGIGKWKVIALVFVAFGLMTVHNQHLAVIDPESIHSSKTGWTIALLLNLTDDKLKCNLREINIFVILLRIFRRKWQR